MTLFKYANNSCYLDTLLISWLHSAPPTIRAQLQNEHDMILGTNYGSSPEMLPKLEILTTLMNLYDILQGDTPEGFTNMKNRKTLLKRATMMRESVRETLQMCPIFDENLEEVQDTATFFDKLLETLNIDMPCVLKETDQVSGTSEPILKSYVTVYPKDKNVLYRLTEESEPEKQGPKTITQRLYKTTGGVLPIEIQRLTYTGDLTTNPINIPETVTLDDGIYTLQSVICHRINIQHFVCYLRCLEDHDKWMYYDDLNVSSKYKYDDVILDEHFMTTKMPGSSKYTPQQSATFLFYVR
jgi:hypothetical protein